MTTYYINTQDLPLGDLVDWCVDNFDMFATSAHEARTNKTWWYSWGGWMSERRWWFCFYQPEQATLFALRWAQYIITNPEPLAHSGTGPR